ncbi:MAG: hypothetical protein KIS88_10530 [Anaerolineales bacterium]|nr:hypothetical protein [Anaerolineales bacterium]
MLKRHDAAVLLKFVIEVFSLFSLLFASVLLRAALAVGQSLPEPIRVPPAALLITALSWAVVFLARERSKRWGDSSLVLIGIAFGLSGLQYCAILLGEAPASRLLLVYLFVGNLLGVILAPKLAVFLSNLKIRLPYEQLSSKLFGYHAEIWAAIVIGLFWAFHISLLGVTVGGDSFSYLLTAMQPMTEGQLQFNQLPPVWPLLLSAWMFISPFTGDGAAFISSACVLLTLIFFALVLRRLSHDSILNIVFLFLLASLQDFIRLFFYGLTEPLYVLFIVVTYYCILTYKLTSKHSYFLGALLLSSLASVTRFMGIALSAVVLLFWVFVDGVQNSLRRTRKAFLFALLSFSPFAFLVWLDATTKSEATVVVPVVTQIESRKLFVYNLGFHSVGATVVDFLNSFWNSMAQQPYVVVSCLVIVLIFSQARKLSKKDRADFRINQFFSLALIAFTLVAIALSGSVPVTRYWMPILPFIFFMFTQAWSYLTVNSLTTSIGLSKALWLFRLLFVLIFGMAVARQAGWISNMVSDSLSRSNGQPVDQALMGFNVSSTANGFRQFFDQASAEYDRFTLLLVSGDRDGEWVLDPEQGWVWAVGEFSMDNAVVRPFLLKQAIFSESLTAFEFVTLSEDYQVLSYKLDSQQRELELIVAANGPLGEQLREVLANVRGPEQGFFLVIHRELFLQLPEQEKEEILSYLQQTHRIDPYLIFSYKK